MRLILLSGGSGKRLWPLSNESRSKQFIKLLTDRDGGMESMAQRMWRQLGAAGLRESAYIATGKAQTDILRSQLGEGVRLIVEPERRDTYPAIALIAAYLHSVEEADPDETIAIVPVDPFVEDHFFSKIQELEHLLSLSGADLALIGAEPTYPSEKYGYIVPDGAPADRHAEYLTIRSFREKPREEEAARLIEQGALWNCGVFAFKLRFMLDWLVSAGFPPRYEELIGRFGSLPATSFDYEVVERTRRTIVTRYEGGWKDLGTWNTLTEEIGDRLIGKGAIGEGCANTHVVNELDIPVYAIGVENAVIAVSPDGVLVSGKAMSAKVKDMPKHLAQRPRFEERRWGWYKVLDFAKLGPGRQVMTKRIYMAAGRNASYHWHRLRDETWTVISGEGEVILNGRLIRIRAGDVIRIPAMARHSVRAATELQFIEVQCGTELGEEDVIRELTEWEEMVSLVAN